MVKYLDGEIQGVEEAEVRGLLARSDDCIREIHGSLTAPGVMPADHRIKGACSMHARNEFERSSV